MEGNQNSESQTQETPQVQGMAGSGVSFPTVNEPKKSGGGKALLLIGTLILVAVLGFVIFKTASKSGGDQIEETPIEGITNDSVTTPEPTTSSTPKAVVRTGVEIEVQNGTGTTGDAAYLEKELKALGYSSVKVGNAKETGATVTKVTFAKTLSQDVVDELTKKLNELYKSVEVVTSSSMTGDVLVITGLKKGATAKPTATVKPSTTPTGSPKATTSASPTPTSTGN